MNTQKPNPKNVENFDDGDTRVAPEGEFKSGANPQAKIEDELENRKYLGIGVGLLIASVPIIITYILFHFGYGENYDLSLFITYTIVTIMSLLIIKRFKKQEEKEL